MSGFLPLTTMDSLQHEALSKMFRNRRLQPGIPEHDLFIKAEIAKLEILEPHDAETFKEFYDKKHAEFEALNAPPVEVVTEVPPLPVEVPLAAVVLVEKKKRGRKPKIS